MLRKLITPIYLKNAHAVCSLSDSGVFCGGDAISLARDYSNKGADILLIFDQSGPDEEHDESLTLMRQMARVSDIPMWGAGNVKRVEDVKKILYAGCKKAVLNYAKASNLQMLEEVSKRFGRDKIAVCVNAQAGENPSPDEMERIGRYAGDLILLAGDPDAGLAAVKEAAGKQDAVRQNHAKDPAFVRQNHAKDPVSVGKDHADDPASVGKNYAKDPVSALHLILLSGSLSDEESCRKLASTAASGIGGACTQDTDADLMGMKARFKEAGMDVNLLTSTFAWEDLKASQQGLIPVVVQDYQNEEVLMVAYMNREAYETTLRTGVMTYWSRSRQELWVKGLTSGHYQYLKELRVDCDCDTLLARVAQVGAACHTGNRSCFYRSALKKDAPQRNPMKVFEDVYATIEDRRRNPKEGSYTNYLFEKGIDKILKKCGEEAAEIIIAAKNPNPEEIKYEAADFLYHLMVLMAERDITWDDIAQELANRE